MIYSRVLILERKLLTATDDFSGRVMSESKQERRSFGVFHCHSRNVPAIPDGPTLTTLSNLWDDCSYPSLKRPAVLTSLFTHTPARAHKHTQIFSTQKKNLAKDCISPLIGWALSPFLTIPPMKLCRRATSPQTPHSAANRAHRLERGGRMNKNIVHKLRLMATVQSSQEGEYRHV